MELGQAVYHMHRRIFLKSTLLYIALHPISGAMALESVFPRGVLSSESQVSDYDVKDRLIRGRLFDHDFKNDIILPREDVSLLNSSLARLKKIQKLIGYGNFSLLNFDDAVGYARSYTRIGRFSNGELEFLEKIFYNQVKDYGFMGEKTIKTITGKIIKKQVKKIPHTGNYLYRGKPIEVYNRIQKQIGGDVILTSGVRSVMKQFLLFLNKTAKSHGNLSMASRSLAPPGYSFHGIGDFDVGKKGFGVANFTEKFTQTQVYKKLSTLGYIKFRYERDNDLGVRFEPWHIEVV